jgi:hypothetical protein
MPLDAVASTQALEAVTFHGAGGAAALAGADDIDGFDIFEHLGDGQQLADLGRGGFFQAKFANVSLGLAVGLGSDLDARRFALAPAIGNQVAGNVAAFLTRRLATGLVLVTDLNGVVAIAFLIADEQNGARSNLQNGDGLELAAFVIDLRHSNFKAQKSQRHGKTLSTRLYEERSTQERQQLHKMYLLGAHPGSRVNGYYATSQRIVQSEWRVARRPGDKGSERHEDRETRESR